jgi:hypothetical protein
MTELPIISELKKKNQITRSKFQIRFKLKNRNSAVVKSGRGI